MMHIDKGGALQLSGALCIIVIVIVKNKELRDVFPSMEMRRMKVKDGMRFSSAAAIWTEVAGTVIGWSCHMTMEGGGV